MADRHLAPDTPELRARWGRTIAAWLIALPAITLMVAIAKAAQFASVDAFGAQLGFNGASLLGVAPVITLYYFAAVKLPRFDVVFGECDR